MLSGLMLLTVSQSSLLQTLEITAPSSLRPPHVSDTTQKHTLPNQLKPQLAYHGGYFPTASYSPSHFVLYPRANRHSPHHLLHSCILPPTPGSTTHSNPRRILYNSILPYRILSRHLGRLHWWHHNRLASPLCRDRTHQQMGFQCPRPNRLSFYRSCR